MELADYLRILRKFWKSVAALTLLGVLAAAAYSMLAKPTYTSTTSIFLTAASVNTAGELNQGASYAENQVQSFARISRTAIVLQPVIDQLGLNITPETLANSVKSTVPTKTATIDIAVVNGDPRLAARIADAIGKRLVATVQELAPPMANGNKTVAATTVRPASVPVVPTTPKVPQNLALGFALGLLLGFGQAVLRDLLATRIVTNHDVERVTDKALLGRVPLEDDANHGGIPWVAEPLSQRGESYRRLRTNLQFLGLGEGEREVVITSSVPGEGKTTTSINIAAALADGGSRVLLIDADLRRPRVGTSLQLESAAGLTTVLIGRADFDDVVQTIGGTTGGKWDVLTSGPIPPNPSDLLGSDAMKNLLSSIGDRYDMVVIDAPPLLPVTDGALLTQMVGGALIVVGSRVARRSELKSAIDVLEKAGGRVLGLVLNRVQRSDTDRYGYGEGYTYETKPRRSKEAAAKESVLLGS